MSILISDVGYSYLERKLILKAFDVSQTIDDKNKSRHISFLVKRNKIISCGKNDSWKSHPESSRWNHWNSAIHSELDAIVKFSGKNLNDHTMYNIRFLRNNKVALSKPCGRCQSMLDYYQIKCWFTNEKGIFECI